MTPRFYRLRFLEPILQKNENITEAITYSQCWVIKLRSALRIFEREYYRDSEVNFMNIR